jgi:cell division septal protein FtsQ
MGQNGTRRGILLFLVLLICMAAIVFLGTEIFQVQKITVLCSGTLEKDVIINLSGVSYGDNIFKIGRDKVKKRIEGNAPFPVVEAVSFRLPDEVILAVEERVPAAVVPYLSSYVVIDASGFIMDIIKQKDEVPYPVVDGIRLNNLTKGSRLDMAESGSYKQKVLVRLLEAVREWKAGDLLQSILLEDPDNITLVTRDNVRIAMGQATELDKKLGWLESDAYTEVLAKGEAGTLDVSVPGKAVFRPESTTDSGQESEDTGQPEEDGEPGD